MLKRSTHVFLTLVFLFVSLAKASTEDDAILNEMGGRLKQLQREIANTENPTRKAQLQATVSQVMEAALPKLSATAQVPLLLGLRVMQPFQKASTDYTAATIAFAESDDLSFGTIKRQSDISKRIARVQELRTANLALIDMLENAESRAAKVISEYMGAITDQQRREFVAGFAKGNRRLAEAALAIRHLDTRMYDTIEQMLKLLDTNWGKWTADEEGFVTWKNEGLETEFSKLGDELTMIAEKQAKAEEAMANKI